MRSDSASWVARRIGIDLAARGPAADPFELAGLALRTSATRSHLIVSTVLGKHVPAAPSVVRKEAEQLGEQVRARLDPGATVLVIGFAETATGLGHHVADTLGADYLHTTRLPDAGAVAVAAFDEPHSHARSHVLAPADSALVRGAGQLVLVDDELSTGTTAMNLVAALDRLRGGRRYVIATYLDTRDGEARARMARDAADLGVVVVVVALCEAHLRVAPGSVDRAVAAVADHPGPAKPAKSLNTPLATVVRIDAGWPEDLPSGGRWGFPHNLAVPWDTAVDRAADRVMSVLDRRDGPTGRVHVLGVEEFTYLPTRIALAIEALSAGTDQVVVSSTTRSPAVVVDEPGYPLRTSVSFEATERGGSGTRWAYNVNLTGVIVLVVDETCDAGSLGCKGGLIEALRPLCRTLIVLTVIGARPRGPALFAPSFSTYRRSEVEWLVTDISAAPLERPAMDRERAIQSGREHYSESLPLEYEPSAAYRALYETTIRRDAVRVAAAVGTLGERVARERGRDVVLVSLARAGVPAGILVRKWLARTRNWDVPHYALSIVRDRGLDLVALEYLLRRFDPRDLLFVDGWTGKGTISAELAQAVDGHPASRDGLSAELAVIADPGRCAPLYGTRQDFLIPSACLNATASGLVSRTVLNRHLIAPNDFHGAKFYAELVDHDVSRTFLDTISGAFSQVEGEATRAAAQAVDPPMSGWAAREISLLCERYAIGDPNLVKPGVGETTRVLLRRIPDRVLLRDPASADVAHIVQLAGERGVAIDVIQDLAYASVGLIRSSIEAVS